MKYAMILVLLVFALGVAGAPLVYAHVITLVPAVFSGFCLGFAMFLADPTQFLAYLSALKAAVVCWFQKKADP